jgi:hypothetical protein
MNPLYLAKTRAIIGQMSLSEISPKVKTLLECDKIRCHSIREHLRHRSEQRDAALSHFWRDLVFGDDLRK